ncbi:uncharacterized protein A4U43_C06F3560 [Asparagus officinalis]|uniref:AB hydrolase-1 domain-containing protein n=1 Tax=Asparagus officinalis TaxID=4686 RepID=A0A5P1EN99_ASPOF|nr:uncharacterized protein LOC109844146 isoform X2 [Asparagus officinalis]ONK66041.1 uncharacterized protein A4U43_C06F3560 [Asparagus officinalis]
MSLTLSIYPPLNLRIARTRTQIRYRRRSQLRIRSSLDELFKTLISSNPLELIPTALTLASGAALYLTKGRVTDRRPEPVVADWILFTSPTPFNRCVLLRCPSISFEDGEESEKLLRDERHFVNLSRGRILARKDESLEEEEEIGYQRVCVGTEDGGVISLDWPEDLDLGREYGRDATVLIVPGTAEGSMDRDVRRFVVDALRSGCFPVVMNPRGCAGSPLTTARLFTAADSDDICTAIKYVNKSRPWTTLMGVGIGYGANMLTKYLADVGESTPLTAAVCIDNPFDLDEATRSFPHHIAMDQKLTGGLTEILRANKELFQGKAKGFDLPKALLATSVRDFDEAVSMISYGFDNVEEFYSMTSTRELVNKLKVPILFIQSDKEAVPLFSVPRGAIAENPFTSLLLCSSHSSVINIIERSTILWCQQLTIEWLLAVELALLKGRHPLLKDVDITINPSKGLSFINGETSENNVDFQNRNGKIYDSDRWFWSQNDANNGTSLKLTSSNKVNKVLVDQFVNEKNGVGHETSSSNSKSESALGMMHKGEGIKEDINADVPDSSSTIGGDSPTDNDGGQVLQTAAVVMNMLDVTMPGTLDNDQKKKVLTAVERGETLVKALEGAVPDEVRGKLTTAVTEIMHTQGTNLNFDAFRRIGWIHNVTSGKSRSQEKSKETSTTESGQDDSHASDLRKNGPGSDGRIHESTDSVPKSTGISEEKAVQTSVNVEAGTEAGGKLSHPDKSEEANTESAPKSSGTSQEKAAQASANAEALTEAGGKPTQPDKSEEANTLIDENTGQVNQSNVKGDKHSAYEQGLYTGNDIQNSEAGKLDSPAEQNIPTSSTSSGEVSSAGSLDSEEKVEENENDLQKNESKFTQDVMDQNVHTSAKSEESSPQHSSSKPPPISVTQALDALTGFDDSTQMAVNSVFGVIEDMIDQFEKASNEENGDELSTNENHELVNQSEKTEDNKDKSGGEPDVVEPSDSPGDSPKEEESGSYEEIQSNSKKMNDSLTSSANDSIDRAKESNTLFKNLENKSLNKVGRVHNFPLDVAGKQYWQSPYAAYIQRHFSTQLPATKSIDLESTTDLFLDPEEGKWRMVDQSGYSKSTLSESGENHINGRDDSENIIEPSYVIVDNEFSIFNHGSAEEHNSVDDNHDDGEAAFMDLIRNTLLDALKMEVGRKLGRPDLKGLESSLVHDLEQFADTVSEEVVHNIGLNLDPFPESDDTDSLKFGTIDANHIIKTISSAVSNSSHLRKVLPVGVVVGSSLASLRTYFQVVSSHDDDQNKDIRESIHVQESSYVKGSETKKVISAGVKYQHVDSGKLINRGCEKLQTDGLNSGGIMVGAVTAAIGASALLAHHEQKEILEQDMSVAFNEKGPHEGDTKLEDSMQEKTHNNMVSSLSEKVMSVASPVVPTKNGGQVDQERLVAILAELGQKGGALRLVGKVALLWGGIRGAMSLTDRLISFLHIADCPLPHRILGFVGMVLVLWSPVVIPLLPTIIQCWTTKTSNSIVTYACIVGLYVAITILVVLWGKRIRGYENPLQQYGLEFTSVSRVYDFCKGLAGGILIVLCIHSVNALLGYARLSLAVLPPSEGALALLNAYANMLVLAVRGAITAIGISLVEEILFRSWLAEEIAVDLGYYRAILISGIAFSLSQRSLPSVPGLLLLSLALFGMKQRTQGNLSASIGMRVGIMTTNFILQTGGFLTYWPKTPLWLASTHPWHPFDGAVGLGSCAILAILFYPKPPQTKEISTEVNE